MIYTTRLEAMRADKTVKEPIDRVFFGDFLKTIGNEGEDDVYLTIWDILRIWGYEDFYPAVISEMSRFVKDDTVVCVYYDTGELSKDMERQKLLGWDIYNMKKEEFELVGGILFQDGKMSLHT